MIKNILSDIGGIGIYGVISMCLFFAVFTGVLLWAFAPEKKSSRTHAARCRSNR